MSTDVGALVVAIIAVIVAAIAALYSRIQAHAASDSAASAVRSADAANEQVAAAREQIALGHRQLELAEKIRREQSEPYIVVDIEPSTIGRNFLVLVIQNIGTTVARDVRFNFTPQLRSARELRLPVADAKIVKNGIPMMPPGRRFEILFDFGPDRYESNLDMTYEVTINADGPHGHIETTSEIDIGVLYGWHPLWPKGIHEGVQTLENMQKDLAKTQAEIRALLNRIQSSSAGND
ncbi:hypothetical protein LUW74_20730 [Actinomadura madurae]|uniref:hypothetical protein n=1 Tax=Actinomadura madurae TaxID=1993 RepID=UPI002026C64D|nr:hypothetical protein [Actinomadura madurae]URN05496.1 hypothetical protein LUW74_20730 [Actinomadura madurae]